MKGYKHYNYIDKLLNVKSLPATIKKQSIQNVIFYIFYNNEEE